MQLLELFFTSEFSHPLFADAAPEFFIIDELAWNLLVAPVKARFLQGSGWLFLEASVQEGFG